MLSVGTVLFLDYLDNTFRSPEDIEQFLGLQILGIIPKYRDEESNAVKSRKKMAMSVMGTITSRRFTARCWFSNAPVHSSR